MSNKAIITFEYLVVNSLLIVNALDQEYKRVFWMCYSTDYILYILFKEGKVMAGVVPPAR